MGARPVEQEQLSGTLLFGDIEIADIVLLNADFPSYAGHYTLLPDVDQQPGAARVLEYIDASVKASPQMETDDYDGAWEEGLADLIDSDQWWLLTSDGEKRSILIPIFFVDNEIVWRDDVHRGGPNLPPPAKKPWWKFW